MLKLFLLTTIFAIAFAQFDALLGKLPSADKCATFNGIDGVHVNDCWAASCGVCVKDGHNMSCIPYATVTVTTVPPSVMVDDHQCVGGMFEKPGVNNWNIPPALMMEYQNNRDIWLSAEEKQAIDVQVDQKYQELYSKCMDPARKQECIASFNAWLGNDAQSLDNAVNQRLEEQRQQWQHAEERYQDAYHNVTSNFQPDTCQSLPFGSPEERRAKYECIYNRQVVALGAFKQRIISLSNVVELHRIELVLLVRLTRDQFDAALTVGVINGVDVLKQLRNVTLQKVRELVVLTFTIAKLKEKINNAIANKDKALAFVDNVRQHAQDTFQNITRRVEDAVNEIKQKADDYKIAVRDFIKAYAKNALECKVLVTSAVSSSTFDIKCNIQLNASEAISSVKSRFQNEVKAVLESQFGVSVDVQAPVDVSDPDIQPQSAKRAIQQGTAPVGTQATVGQSSQQTTTGSSQNDVTDGSASTIVLSLSLLAMALFAMLF